MLVENPARTAPVGIDDLNVYGSTLAVDFAAIAAARGASARELAATGFTRRSVTPPYEDPVTLAVNAALPLVTSAGRAAFDLLIVATESGVDYGKPLSAYVHEQLGLPSRCRNLELKHACYAGTGAIQLAAAGLRGGSSSDQKALVVMTDLARQHVGGPAEFTAGTGAVAVSISRNPQVLELEPYSGRACREVYDVARPNPTYEWGDAVLSLAAYLDLLEAAWLDYGRSNGGPASLQQRFRYALYHTPLVSLAAQAHALLLEADAPDISDDEQRASFDAMVRPALGHAQQLANIYSGSVYSVLAGLLDGAADVPAGTRVALCSYGSGSCAEIFSGRVAEAARETVARHDIAEHLAQRAPVDVALYERLASETDAMMVARDYEPAIDFVPGHFERSYRNRQRLVLRRIENHHRQYAWADAW